MTYADSSTSPPGDETAPPPIPPSDPGDLGKALDRIHEDAAADEPPQEEGPRRRVLLALGVVGAVAFLWMLFRPIPHDDRGAAPPRSGADAVDRMAAEADPGWMRAADTARLSPGGVPPVPPVYETGATQPVAGDTLAGGTGSLASDTSVSPAPVQEVDPRREAFRSAMRAKPLSSGSAIRLEVSEGAGSDGAIPPAPTYAEMATAAEREAVARTSGTTEDGLSTVASGPAPSGYGGGPRLAAPARLAPRMATVSERAATLAIGTVIDGELAVPIIAQRPGEAIGVVSRPVYDVSLRHVVIPAGSWLYGTYDSTAIGQSRVVVHWLAIRFPDGTTYELPALRAGDGTGASGIPGRVNNHYRTVFGHALLSSVIAAGFSGTGSAPTQPSRRDAMADAAATRLGETAAQVTSRNLAIKPTITVPRLTPFTIILDRELTFLPPDR